MIITCEVCGTQNEDSVLFCSKCVSPINIQKISDYTEEDKQFMLTLLLDSIAKARAKAQQEGKSPEISKYWKEYLNVYWLRPETAIWRTVEAEIMIRQHWLQEPLLDAGCGDGINMSILAGNCFAEEFDTFQDVALHKKDIYDHATDEYLPKIAIRAPRKITAGIDIKAPLVQKAQKLGTYQEVVAGDIHHLPWNNETFKTVYSNVIKDFAQVQPLLKEAHRVLQKNGTLIITTPTETFKQNLFFINEAQRLQEQGNHAQAQKYIAYDRGRSVYSATQKNAAEWEIELQQAGFKVLNMVRYVSPQLTNLFDVGTRAFSVDAIARYRKYLNEGQGIALKQAALPLISSLFAPYLQLEEHPQGSFMIIRAQKV